jgi:hypothetical protein
MASLDGATSFLELVGDLVADRKLCSTLKLVINIRLKDLMELFAEDQK